MVTVVSEWIECDGVIISRQQRDVAVTVCVVTAGNEVYITVRTGIATLWPIGRSALSGNDDL